MAEEYILSTAEVQNIKNIIKNVSELRKKLMAKSGVTSYSKLNKEDQEKLSDAYRKANNLITNIAYKKLEKIKKSSGYIDAAKELGKNIADIIEPARKEYGLTEFEEIESPSGGIQKPISEKIGILIPNILPNEEKLDKDLLNAYRNSINERSVAYRAAYTAKSEEEIDKLPALTPNEKTFAKEIFAQVKKDVEAEASANKETK